MTGNQFKEIREKLKMRREDFAVRLELAYSTISRIESLKDKEIPNSKVYELALNSLIESEAKKAA